MRCRARWRPKNRNLLVKTEPIPCTARPRSARFYWQCPSNLLTLRTFDYGEGNSRKIVECRLRESVDGQFLLYFSFMLLSPLLPLYLSETFGADKEAIGIVLSGYTLTALAMRMLSGYVVDTFPRKTVLLIGYFFLRSSSPVIWQRGRCSFSPSCVRCTERRSALRPLPTARWLSMCCPRRAVRRASATTD